MAITKGQASTLHAAAATTSATTFATNPTAGNAILVAAGSFSGGSPTATDNASPSSNTYTICTDGTHSANATNGSLRYAILKCDNLKLPSSGSLTVTVSMSGSAATIAFAEEIIGAATGNVEFAATATGSANPEAVASGGGSTDDLYWGVSGDNAASGTVTYTYGNSFTQEAHEGDNNTFQDMAVASKGFGGGTSGTQTYSATSSPTNSQWAATVVAIKPTGGTSISIAGASLLKFSAGATLAVSKVLADTPSLKFGGAANATTGAQDLIAGAPLLAFSVRAAPSEAISLLGAPLLKFSTVGALVQSDVVAGSPLLRFGATATLSAAGTAFLSGTPLLSLRAIGNLVKFERVMMMAEEERKRRRWKMYP